MLQEITISGFTNSAGTLQNISFTYQVFGRELGDYINSAAKIKGTIHIVTVNSDGFFLADENWETYVNLSLIKENINIYEIKSIHGHDAFSIENAQLSGFLKPIFNTNKIQNEKDQHSALWSR